MTTPEENRSRGEPPRRRPATAQARGESPAEPGSDGETDAGGDRDEGGGAGPGREDRGGQRSAPAEAQGRREADRSRPRGPGRRYRGAGAPDGRESPARIGGLIGALFEKWGIAEKVERAAVAQRWEEMVGPEIAARTGEVRVDGRVLVVEVESASWMQNLNMMRHQILRKINGGREKGRIERIVFVQKGS